MYDLTKVLSVIHNECIFHLFERKNVLQECRRGECMRLTAGVEPVQAMGMTHVGSQSDSVGGGECTSFL